MIKNSMIRAMCIACVCFSGQAVFSQTQPVDVRVALTDAVTGYVTGRFYITLPDSNGISEVDAQLIDSIDDSLLFNHSFLFDQSSGLPEGLSWQRNGVEVELGTGTLPVRMAWVGRVRLKNTSNQWSDWYEFLF